MAIPSGHTDHMIGVRKRMYEEVMISVKDVCKTFETKEAVVEALDHVNLEIHKGEIYGII